MSALVTSWPESAHRVFETDCGPGHGWRLRARSFSTIGGGFDDAEQLCDIGVTRRCIRSPRPAGQGRRFTMRVASRRTAALPRLREPMSAPRLSHQPPWASAGTPRSSAGLASLQAQAVENRLPPPLDPCPQSTAARGPSCSSAGVAPRRRSATCRGPVPRTRCSRSSATKTERTGLRAPAKSRPSVPAATRPHEAQRFAGIPAPACSE
jgi:hypothetical protein